MGNGIAQACAVAGVNVVMVDIAQAAVDKGIATVAGSLDRLIKKDKLTAAQKDAALALIKGSTNYDDLAFAGDGSEAIARTGGRLSLFRPSPASARTSCSPRRAPGRGRSCRRP